MIKLLRWLGTRIVSVQQPKIVGITGSIGKTTTKDMIAAVLQGHVSMRATEKNYNNEIGVPLTIIGMGAPGTSLIKWVALLLKGFSLTLVKSASYPKVLVIEMGADHPGDILKLTQMAPCDIGVLTWIGHAHYEFFESPAAIANEKKVIVTHLMKTGVAIGDVDNDLVASVLDESMRASKVVRVGLLEGIDFTARDIAVSVHQITKKPVGLHAVVEYGEERASLVLHGVVGTAYVRSALLACAVAAEFGIGLHSAAATLSEHFKGTPSRMRVIEGIKNTTIIDDSYNASPQATIHAIEVLSAMPRQLNGKRYAALGDMLELGSITEQAHAEIGQLVAKSDIDLLICVGEHMRSAQRAAIQAGMPTESIFFFAHSADAGRFLQELLKEGDVLLVKGSQGARMEKIVIELMENPLQAPEMVCRSYGKWHSG